MGIATKDAVRPFGASWLDIGIGFGNCLAWWV